MVDGSKQSTTRVKQKTVSRVSLVDLKKVFSLKRIMPKPIILIRALERQ